MAETVPETLVMPTQITCTFTNNISIQHKMSLLDGDGGVGNWRIKATVIMIHPTGRLLNIFLKNTDFFHALKKLLILLDKTNKKMENK